MMRIRGLLVCVLALVGCAGPLQGLRVGNTGPTNYLIERWPTAVSLSCNARLRRLRVVEAHQAAFEERCAQRYDAIYGCSSFDSDGPLVMVSIDNPKWYPDVSRQLICHEGAHILAGCLDHNMDGAHSRKELWDPDTGLSARCQAATAPK